MRTSSLTNPELVTIAVALLDGDTELVDREDIAVKVNEIAPGRFSWRKFPERIDLSLVAVALRDAKKAAKGALLVGNNATGWMLSPAGVRWFRGVNINDFLDASLARQRRASITANQQAECIRLRRTRAYLLYAACKSEAISVQDFHEFARLNEYFQAKARQRRYALLDNAVADDEALCALWNLMKGRFAQEGG